MTFAEGARTIELTGPSTQFIASASQSSDPAQTPRSPTPQSAPSSVLASADLGRANISSRSIDAKSLLGRPVDLIDPELPYASRITSAILVPVEGDDWLVSASTDLSDMQSFNPAGNLMQFNAPFGTRAATYLSGNADLLDSGSNGRSGIRWGRWSGGSAMVSTVNGSEKIDLQDQSLHWISGPTFEAPRKSRRQAKVISC